MGQAPVGRSNGLSGLNTGQYAKVVTENVRKQPDFFCVICTMPFKDEDECCVLACNEQHVFHNPCLENWFKRAATCPVCRADAA